MTIRVFPVALLCGLIGLVSAADARDVAMSGEAGVHVASSYTWRGKEVNDKPVVQPEVTLSIEQFTLDVWGTWDVKGTSETAERTRIDASLDYGFVWKMLQCKAGLVAHAYHDDPGGKASDTYEIFADVAADVSYCPSLVIYYDFGNIGGIYAALGVAETSEINAWASVNFEMSLGMGDERFNERFFGLPDALPAEDGTVAEPISTKKAALVDFSVALSVPMRLDWRQVNVTPKVEYVSLVDSDLRAAALAAGDHADRVIGSVTVSFDF